MKIKMLAAFILLLMLTRTRVYAKDVVYFYSDVPGTHPAYSLIKQYHENGLLDDDVMFRPDDAITQEEFNDLSERFYLTGNVDMVEGMSRADALNKLHTAKLLEKEGEPVQCILKFDGEYIVDYSIGKELSTIIYATNGAGVSVVPIQEGYRWKVPDAEGCTVYGTTIDSDGNSDSKVYNLIKPTQHQPSVWTGKFEQIYFLNNEKYVPVSQSEAAGEYVRFIQDGEVGRQEVFSVSEDWNDSYEAQEAVQIRQIEKQRILSLPNKFEVGSDGYAYIQFQNNPSDLSSLYIHYGDKRMKASELPVKTDLPGEYIVEYEDKYYQTVVVKDMPLVEFKTFRPVTFVNSVSEASPANKNVLIVDDTVGIDVAAAISKNVYIIAAHDGANIIGIVNGELGTELPDRDVEYSTVFAVGEEIGYERPESKLEKWTYRAAGKKDQVSLTPIARFDAPAKYFVEYVTTNGVSLSSKYKTSVVQQSKEMGTSQQFTNINNPTVSMDEFVTQQAPEWFKAIRIENVENVFHITERYSQLNIEASEAVIVDKDGNIDDTVGAISKDMRFTCYKQGNYDAYILYRQGNVVRRALLKVDYSRKDVIAINDMIKVKWAEEIPLAGIIENDIGMDDNAVPSIVLQPVYGVVEVQGGSIIYRPEKGFFGSDILYYRVGDSNIAQVVVEVEAVSIPPVVPNSSFIMPIDAGSMRLDVLANAVSLDGQVLKITKAVSSKGSVKIVAGNFYDMLELSFEQKDVKSGETIKVDFTVAGGVQATAAVKVGDKDNGTIIIKERPTAYITSDENGINCQTTGDVVEWRWKIGKDEQTFFTEQEGISWVNSVGVRGRIVQLKVVDTDGLESIPDVLSAVSFNLNKDTYFEGDDFRILNKDADAEYSVSTKVGQHVITSTSESEIFDAVCSIINNSSIREFIIENGGYTVDFRVYLKTDKPQVQFSF